MPKVHATYARTPKPCANCLATYMPTGNCAKYCKACQPKMKKLKSSAYHQKTYVRRGYNQARSNNNAWKGGIGIYRELCTKDACERCGSKKNLLVHHKDGNRYNNNPLNLERLCKRCHQIEHNCWKALPSKTRLSALKKRQAKKAKRGKNGRFLKV